MSLLQQLLPLLPALLKLLPADTPAPPRHFWRRLALRVALILIPVLLLLVAAAFAITALYMVLAETLSPPAAAGIVALILCVLVGLEAIVVLVLDRAAENGRAQAARREREQMPEPLEEVGRLIRTKPLASVLVAAAAGTLVALLGRRR